MSSLTGRKGKSKDSNFGKSPARSSDGNDFLFGQFLVATPGIVGSCFERSVVFVSAHDKAGSLGIIVNKEMKNVNSKEMLETMGVKLPKNFKNLPVYLGGPVDSGRGFVIHSNDYAVTNTIKYDCGVCVTSERKVLQDYVDGVGPKKLILALGYSGWVRGQLENEVLEGSWLNLPADSELIFNPNNDGKWQKSAQLHGIDINKVSPEVGLA